MFPMIFKRSLASTSQVQVPLRLYNLEGRYATALYSAAAKNGIITSVASEITKARSAIAKSTQLQAFLVDPSLSSENKKASVLQLLGAQQYSEIVTNFFKVLAENGRLSLTPKILEGFEEIMKAHRKEVTVKITSAAELNREALEKIKEILTSKFIEKGDIPKITTSVDSKLLGGMVIEIGDKTIDMSVLTQVSKLNKSLEETI